MIVFWIIVGLIVWFVVALGIGIIVGMSIRDADRRDGRHCARPKHETREPMDDHSI